ncbi:hypothetical protein T484DRAFT_1893503, partial [Baffinella frigidus]
MVIGPGPAQLGDAFPVRLRFAGFTDHAGGGPAKGAPRPKYHAPSVQDGGKIKVREERLFSTASLKARVPRSQMKNIRPPDQERLGTKDNNKVAFIGGEQLVYNTGRFANVVTVHTKTGPGWRDVERDVHNDAALDVPESHPYPWHGRADKDQGQWLKQAKDFHRKQDNEALEKENLVKAKRVESIRAQEGRKWRAEHYREVTYPRREYAGPGKTSKDKEKLLAEKSRDLAGLVPDLVRNLGG